MENSETLSEKLQALIIHPKELAERLANGEFNEYKPIRLEYLEKEAYGGILLKEEFRELCIQDILKMSAKIWENERPSVDIWDKVLELYSNNKFLAFTGNSFSKANIVEGMKALRWRLNWVLEWFQEHKDINPLPPSDYFDFRKKSKEEGGFEYSKQKYDEYLNSQCQISENDKTCGVISCIHRQKVL